MSDPAVRSVGLSLLPTSESFGLAALFCISSRERADHGIILGDY
jgi:hypothetical protein